VISPSKYSVIAADGGGDGGRTRNSAAAGDDAARTNTITQTRTHAAYSACKRAVAT